MSVLAQTPGMTKVRERRAGQRWEYIMAHEFSELNRLGAEGWRVVQAAAAGGPGKMVVSWLMERPL